MKTSVWIFHGHAGPLNIYKSGIHSASQSHNFVLHLFLVRQINWSCVTDRHHGWILKAMLSMPEEAVPVMAAIWWSRKLNSFFLTWSKGCSSQFHFWAWLGNSGVVILKSKIWKISLALIQLIWSMFACMLETQLWWLQLELTHWPYSLDSLDTHWILSYFGFFSSKWQIGYERTLNQIQASKCLLLTCGWNCRHYVLVLPSMIVIHLLMKMSCDSCHVGAHNQQPGPLTI